MKILPAMIAVADQLDALNRAVPKSDAAAVRVALARASNIMVEYAAVRILRGEPSSLARCIINQAAGRVMGRPEAQSRTTSDPGASNKAERDRKGRVEPKQGKKRARVRPAQAKAAGKK